MQMQLIDYFKQGCKQEKRIGLEVEHFVLNRKDGSPLVQGGMKAMLESLLPLYPIHHYEQEALIGLESEDVLITLEPGFQLEISIQCLSDTKEIIEIYLNALKPILRYLHDHDYDLVYSGGLPTLEAEKVALIHKERYRLMDRYFRTSGTRGIEMMRATAAIHVSVDYEDEADFVQKYRLANILHPLFAFITGNTPKYAGRDNEDILLRDSIWQGTDSARCGIIPTLFDEEFGFQSYADHILDMPLILMRDGEDFLSTDDQKVKDVAKTYGMETKAIEHYLSMSFLDVRLKKFIEIRSADSMPWIYAQAYCTWLKGLFYNKEILYKYCDLANSIEDIQSAKENLRKYGFDAIVYGKKLCDLYKDLFAEAKTYLSQKEKGYLLPLEELVMKKEHIQPLSKEQFYHKAIQANWIESKISALNITNQIQKSELNLGKNAYTRTLHIPKFFTQEDKNNFNFIVNRMMGIFSKVIHAYHQDEKIRSLFDFDSRLEELILCKPNYDPLIPICRVDIFYDEKSKDFHFCEFNTDGTSAMNENKRLNDFLQYHNLYCIDPDTYEIMELVESWVDAFLQTMKEDPSVPEHANIAICDFLENAYITELYVFEKAFRKRGYSCDVIDIRNLEYKDGNLYSTRTKKRVDVIYRRAVTRDVMDHYEEVLPFVQAYLDKNVCCIGAFQTQLIHHKKISQVLVHPIMQAYFTNEEVDFLDAHLPKTYDLNEDKLQELLENKDHWIIKPKDSYASKGVWAGIDLSQEKWQEALQDSVNQNYIAQEYITPYKNWNIDLVNYDEFKWYSNMSGLYVYNGKFAGVYSRCSDSGIISTQYNEKTVPTLFVR